MHYHPVIDARFIACANIVNWCSSLRDCSIQIDQEIRITTPHSECELTDFTRPTGNLSEPIDERLNVRICVPKLIHVQMLKYGYQITSMICVRMCKTDKIYFP